MKIRILGSIWHIKPAARRTLDKHCRDNGVSGTADGLCVWHARQLLYYDRLKGIDKLETIIHEFAHAAHPNHTEEWVTEFAHDLAVALDKLGYV